MSADIRDRVFPDTATLYPISVADLLLRSAELGLIELLWSEHLLTEVIRVLTDYKGIRRSAAEYFCNCIRQTFPDGEIAPSSYAHLLSTRSGPDPDDHEHSAAASAANATVLLSADRTGFPSRDTFPARRRHPDAYFVELLARHPVELLTVIREMGNARRDPESPEQTINALRRAGLRKFAVSATRLLTN